MGCVKGQIHQKKRVYIGDKRGELLARYEEAVAAGVFLTQKQLGDEFEISQVAVSKILRESGLKTRTREEASPITFDVKEASRIYLENPKMTIEAVADLFNMSAYPVNEQFRRMGVPIWKMRDYAKYECDRDFFKVIDPVRAYFAGFIAADGYIAKTGRCVNFGIHPKDTEIFDNLKKHARLEQPIVVRPNCTGKLYSWLSIGSIDWVEALERTYNIVNRKSLILQPPNISDPEIVWPFIRGYFDGDGHASADGNRLNLISASPDMFEWLLQYCGKPGHIQIQTWLLSDKETEHSAQSAFFTGDIARTMAKNMYRNSTPDLRLGRKFDRARKLLTS